MNRYNWPEYKQARQEKLFPAKSLRLIPIGWDNHWKYGGSTYWDYPNIFNWRLSFCLVNEDEPLEFIEYDEEENVFLRPENTFRSKAIKQQCLSILDEFHSNLEESFRCLCFDYELNRKYIKDIIFTSTLTMFFKYSEKYNLPLKIKESATLDAFQTYRLKDSKITRKRYLASILEEIIAFFKTRPSGWTEDPTPYETLCHLSTQARFEEAETLPKKTKTYLMKDKLSGLYKIGKSKNPSFREKTLQSEKPSIEMVKVWDNNIENKLHNDYQEYRIRGEWFSLTPIQVKYISTHY